MIRAYVDQIHGDMSRVLIGDEAVAVSIPLRLLPPATGEGTVLRVHFTMDTAATLAKKASARRYGSADE